MEAGQEPGQSKQLTLEGTPWMPCNRSAELDPAIGSGDRKKDSQGAVPLPFPRSREAGATVQDRAPRRR